MPAAARAAASYAALTEKERALTSARTKAALAAKKAAGAKLGNPRAVEAAVKPQAAHRANADRFAAEMLPMIEGIRAAGISTLGGIADALNKRGVPTARAGRWHAMTVRNLIARKLLIARNSRASALR